MKLQQRCMEQRCNCNQLLKPPSKQAAKLQAAPYATKNWVENEKL